MNHVIFYEIYEYNDTGHVTQLSIILSFHMKEYSNPYMIEFPV